MECRAIFVIEPVTRVHRKELDLGTFRKVGGFVNHQASLQHPRLQRHAEKGTSECRC